MSVLWIWFCFMATGFAQIVTHVYPDPHGTALMLINFGYVGKSNMLYIAPSIVRDVKGFANSQNLW